MHVAHDLKLSAIDLNLLVVLAALLEERHVTRAASRVGLSQSATSHALSRLRELYGDPLLVRSGRRLDLTPRALGLLPQLAHGLAELRGTLSGASAFEPKTARRRFTVGMADYGQALLVPPLLRLLKTQAPGIDLSIISFPNAVERLDDGSMDAAVLVGWEFPKGLASRKLFSDGFTCMARKDHPQLRGTRLPLARYMEQSHVLVAPSGSPTTSLVDSELERRGLVRRIALTVSSFLIAPQVVVESDLVSTGPSRLLRALSKRYPIRLFEPPFRLPRFEQHLVWHSRLEHDPGQIWLREQIQELSHAL
jgi:DNA-binding transcriptional LysR family regulator